MFAIILDDVWQSQAYWTLDQALKAHTTFSGTFMNLQQILNAHKSVRIVSFKMEGPFPDGKPVIIKTYYDTEGWAG